MIRILFLAALCMFSSCSPNPSAIKSKPEPAKSTGPGQQHQNSLAGIILPKVLGLDDLQLSPFVDILVTPEEKIFEDQSEIFSLEHVLHNSQNKIANAEHVIDLEVLSTIFIIKYPALSFPADCEEGLIAYESFEDAANTENHLSENNIAHMESASFMQIFRMKDKLVSAPTIEFVTIAEIKYSISGKEFSSISPIVMQYQYNGTDWIAQN